MVGPTTLNEIANTPHARRAEAERRFGPASTAGRQGRTVRSQSPPPGGELETEGVAAEAGFGERVWIAALGGRIVGMIRLAEEGDGVARVQRVYVDPEWQHTSVPGSLADRARAFCRQAGYVRVAFARGSAPSWFRSLAHRRGLADRNATQQAAGR